MITYQARPFYEVKIGKRTLSFDYHGIYETEDTAEIAVLDGLVPEYIRRTDDSKTASKADIEKTEDKLKSRKASAK